MIKIRAIRTAVFAVSCCALAVAGRAEGLSPNALSPLPLGSVRPEGWLKYQLSLMTEGLVGRLYENSEFLSPSNGWICAGGSGWEPWGKLQQNIEVGQVTSLNNFIGNGIYSGVYTNGSSFFETFVMVVINNYAVAGATGQVRSISQFKYALNVDSTFSYKTRTGRGNTGIEWGSWVDLGAATTTDIQDNSITAQKLSGDVREKVEKVQELSTGIADVRGFSILANFQVPVQSNVKVVGRIEFPAVMENGALLYLKYVQNYTVGNNGIRFYQNSAVAANLITPTPWLKLTYPT